MKRQIYWFIISLLVSGVVTVAWCSAHEKINPAPIASQKESNVEVSSKPPVTGATVSGAPTAEPLEWSKIESADYGRLKAHLEAVNCPKETISDILYFRIETEYQYKISKLVNPLEKYWGPANEVGASKARVAELYKERSQLLASLNVKDPNPIETGPEKPPSKTDQLSPQKLKAISDITARYPNEPLTSTATEHEKEVHYKNRQARVDYLASVLTPDELYHYRVEKDSNAKFMGRYLAQLGLSDEEFKKVAFIADFSEIKIVNWQLWPPSEEDALRDALGPERYEQYRQIYAPENASFNSFVLASDVTASQAQQLKALEQRQMAEDDFRRAVFNLLGQRNGEAYFSRVH